MEKIFNDIDVLLQRLVLGNNNLFDGGTLNDDKQYALLRVSRFLKSNVESTDPQKLEFRLRLAAHLSPIEAIDFNSSSTSTRWELIYDFLSKEFGKVGEIIEELSRDVASVLDSWQSSRKKVSSYAHKLLLKQNNLCAHCHLDFSINKAGLTDEFKPYHLSLPELMKPEVDHIDPVSCLGDNAEDNLQVLCRICNAGKGDGMGFDVRRELDHAAKEVSHIKEIHRFRMLFYVIQRDMNECQKCHSKSNELTIRKIFERGGFLRSNFISVCYECLK